MLWLLLVSLVWAFSFGLIKGRLTGVDPALVSLIRVALALAVFVPLFRWRGLRSRDAWVLTGIGAIQFGVMYVCYTAAFKELKAYEIAVLTIFTPVFVSLIESAAARRMSAVPLIAAVLAVVGAGVIVIHKPLAEVSWSGLMLVQASNACFAFGQVAWRRWRIARPAVVDAQVFALLYAGAVVAALPFALPALGTLGQLTASHWLTLLYLGLIASGAGFFLWNLGAARTEPGTLAVANNAKIPLGVACSLLFFGESGDPGRLAVGGLAIVAAGVLAEWSARRQRPNAGLRRVEPDLRAG